MFKKFIIYFVLFSLVFSASCTAKDNNQSKNIKSNNISAKSTKSTVKPPVKTDKIKDIVDDMSLDEKIGQMVMSGLDGYTNDSHSTELINKYHIGGFILLGGNIKNSDQMLSLINSLKNTNLNNRLPLFISTDQEGGRVNRLPGDVYKFPSNGAVGKINNPAYSYKIGEAMGYALKQFGINLDFAPVLDINSNPNNPVIGDRSFGDNADLVSSLGVQTANGLHSQGIITTGKHFPGHGDTSTDSHLGLPVVYNDMTRLNSFELKPFKSAINNGIDMMMVAHILLPKIDPKYPSTMSKTIISDILRKQLNYNGVVITDDMTMGAITKNYDIGMAAVTSVNAGADIILVCNGFDKETAVINALKQAVLNGSISTDRIDESVYRIISLKRKYNLADETISNVDTSKINAQINNILK